jgi:hypothetical protein
LRSSPRARSVFAVTLIATEYRRLTMSLSIRCNDCKVERAREAFAVIEMLRPRELSWVS